ncbi:hypothetical protein [Kitasatospora sp. NPDC093558]|uniref:hypothetical protein n=1 Tax=Kitasatospora sp. NPDC093558 TaxID=3155201 RepID=UPI00342A3618
MMDESLEEAWDFTLACARSIDDEYQRSQELGLTALMISARPSGVGRFFPFTSHGRLCFSTGPRWWTADGGELLPAFVTVDRDGGYQVWAGGPYPKAADEAVVVLETENPVEAAAKVEDILASRIE